MAKINFFNQYKPQLNYLSKTIPTDLAQIKRTKYQYNELIKTKQKLINQLKIGSERQNILEQKYKKEQQRIKKLNLKKKDLKNQIRQKYRLASNICLSRTISSPMALQRKSSRKQYIRQKMISEKRNTVSELKKRKSDWQRDRFLRKQKELNRKIQMASKIKADENRIVRMKTILRQQKHNKLIQEQKQQYRKQIKANKKLHEYIKQLNNNITNSKQTIRHRKQQIKSKQKQISNNYFYNNFQKNNKKYQFKPQLSPFSQSYSNTSDQFNQNYKSIHKQYIIQSLQQIYSNQYINQRNQYINQKKQSYNKHHINHIHYSAQQKQSNINQYIHNPYHQQLKTTQS